MGSTTAHSTHTGLRETGRTAATSVMLWTSVVLAMALFTALAFAAHNVPYFPIDLQVARAVQSIPMPWFHSLMVAVSWPGFPPQVFVFVALIVLAYYLAHRRREALYVAVTTVGIGTLSSGIKILVNRPRPPVGLIHVLDPSLNGGRWSFPAGHVESYVAILGFVFFLAYTTQRPSLGRGLVLLITALIIVLIGPSRIDSGEHWFSDVVGGYLLGAAWLAVTIHFYKRGRPTRPEQRATAPSGRNAPP